VRVGFLDKWNDRTFRALVESEYNCVKENRRSAIHMGVKLGMASDGNGRSVDEEHTRLARDQVRRVEKVEGGDAP